MPQGASVVPADRALESPADLEQLVRELLAALAAAALVRLDDDGSASPGLELAALLGAASWPDVIDAKFVDQHGQQYHLSLDVFHGAGGRWSRLAEPVI
jgi:hypothetical protein